MIKINLAPPEELENKYWWLPDFIAASGSCLIVGLLVMSFLKTIEISTLNFVEQKKEFDKSYDRLRPELERFDQLNKKIRLLDEKLKSLRNITISKIAKYKPIIVLEHLQTLKPDGLWFTYLNDDTTNNVIQLVGGAFDNLIIAEFISAIESTKFQEMNANELRTHIYFPKTYLEKVSSVGNKTFQNQNKINSEFEKTKDAALENSGAGKHWDDINTIFPELKEFPSWQLNIKYAEREDAINQPKADLSPNLSKKNGI